MGFELTNGQKTAIKRLKMWWKLTSSQQVFEIAGYAGTGKSTIVYTAMQELGLNIKEDVKFVAFTGKAALVLNQKGVPATTIHKLIYETREQDVPKLDAFGNKVKDDNGNLVYKKVTKFVKVPALPAYIKLIVADECSMISQDLWEDLCSFGIPIIVLGDPGQLPPIYGSSPLLKNPDVMLTEVMRQAEDNPIIQLSMMMRQGQRIPYGRYGKRVAVVRLNEVSDRMLMNSDINLVTTNQTRDELNNYMRYELFKRRFETPEKGDKIICRKNDWETIVDDIPLINGLIGEVINPIDKDSMTNKSFRMDFKPDFFIDSYYENLEVNLNMFKEPDHKKRREIIGSKYEEGQKFEYANAITTHLSQGSSWKKVLVYYQPYGDREMRRQLGYTAITRSEDLLILAQ
jgi:exodeoxyribonuclease V